MRKDEALRRLLAVKSGKVRLTEKGQEALTERRKRQGTENARKLSLDMQRPIDGPGNDVAWIFGDE